MTTRVCLARVQDLFEDIDTDGSGGVSLEELTEGLTKQGYNLTPNEIEQLVCVCVCVCVCVTPNEIEQLVSEGGGRVENPSCHTDQVVE